MTHSASRAIGALVASALLGGCNALVGVEDVVAGEGTGGSSSDGTSATTTAVATSTSTATGDGGAGGGATGPASGGGSAESTAESTADTTTGTTSGSGGEAPNCSDELLGPGETDFDCGGPCPPCADGDHCGEAADCASGICTNGTCAAPACGDGVTNGDETDLDCGGSCDDVCHFGQGCGDDDDCVDSATCELGRCAPEPVGVWVSGTALPAEAVADPNAILIDTSMFYDASRGWSVLYGGYNPPGSTNDFTWSYAGAWQDLAPNSRPWARAGAEAAYDRQRGRAVLFGGGLGAPTQETWEWISAEAEWELVDAGTGDAPYRTAYQSLAYDEARGVSVLYGGVGGEAERTEVVEWDGDHWTFPPQGAEQPLGRYRTGWAWHGGLGELVAFGGNDGSGGVAALLGDTWSWNGTRWKRRGEDGPSPSPRDDLLMAYDSHRDRIVLFGGYTAAGHVAETWEFDGERWLQITRFAGSQPEPNPDGAMVYDEARRRVVMLRSVDRAVREYYTLATPCEADEECPSGACEDHLCCSGPCDDGDSCATEANPGFCEDAAE